MVRFLKIIYGGWFMKLMKKLEEIFSAIAFAEAGEVEAARECLSKKNITGKTVLKKKRGLNDQVAFVTK